jgi:hypothetical protein
MVMLFGLRANFQPRPEVLGFNYCFSFSVVYSSDDFDYGTVVGQIHSRVHIDIKSIFLVFLPKISGSILLNLVGDKLVGLLFRFGLRGDD